MSTKYLPLFTLLISFNFSLFSQTESCGFDYTPEAQQYYDSIKDQIKELEDEYLVEDLGSRSSRVISSVPIKIHIIRTSTGTGGLTVTELNDALTIMNNYYANASLEFFMCEGINYIDNDGFYDFETNEEGALTSVNNVNGVINIYFANSIVRSNNGGGLCGYAYFPGGPETIMMANGCATNGSTLSHEMGHFFALSHTHGNSNVIGSTAELVDGSNCETTGDFICDTPADPQLGNFNVNGACDYTGFAQDANFDMYQPEPRNIMSYSRRVCRTLFSPQQYARINAVYQLTRINMSCPSFNINFTADNTESCSTGLTVNFTDNSVGATSWAWDVNGDNATDYTTQNVTHTYNSFGDYDVALTISNGTDEITQLKTEYIEVGSQEISSSTITLELTLDDWPAETTWQFLDASGNALYSGGPYVEGVDDFTTKTEVFNINTDECYSFVIADSYGDGICCASGNGNYRLVSDSNEELATGGDFNSGTTDNFFNGTLSTNEFNSQEIRLYPNPSNSFIHITTKERPKAYTIYNALGQIVGESQVGFDENLKIDVSPLSKGMYFIKLTKDNANQTLSFIRE